VAVPSLQHAGTSGPGGVPRHNKGPRYLLVALLGFFALIFVSIVIAALIIDHDQHAAVAPLPPSEYTISVRCCTVNSFGTTVAVGTLTRLTQSGHFSVVGRFYNARTGQYIGNGGYPISDPSLPATLTVTTTTPLPKVPVRCTITLSWDNPQPINLS
jgi:hypothetical protein